MFRTAASLRLAVLVISAYVVALVWATVSESVYGTPAAQFGFYKTRWFLALNVLLALNVACAAVWRSPWKRHQTGFVITHAGILVLMFGCLVTYLRGVDAQLPVFEGHAANRAVKTSQHFRLEVTRDEGPASAAAETITVPFRAGPFSWDDYDRMGWWRRGMGTRSRGVIYDRDGLKLEVRDYYGDSRRLAIPRITLLADAGPAAAKQPGEPTETQRLTLAVSRTRHPHGASRPFGLGQQRTTADEHQIMFYLAGSEAETRGFLNSRPQGALGPDGQVVLYARGETFHLNVEQLADQPRQPLGQTGLEVELSGVDRDLLGVQLRVHGPDGEPEEMRLFAGLPHLSRQAYRKAVFGTYWFDPAAEDTSNEAAGFRQNVRRLVGLPRVDLLQGQDGKLYYRTWHAPQVGAVAAWPGQHRDDRGAEGHEIVAFADSDKPLRLHLDELMPSDKPAWIVRKRPFRKGNKLAQRRARVRLSLDQTTEEFWLAGPPDVPPRDDERRVVQGDGRRVAITMPHDYIDLGFRVYLHRFERKLDPGSGMPSHYASVVDFVKLPDEEQKQREPFGRPPQIRRDQRLEENVTITLNSPVDFLDPETGRSYRLFQASFTGPWQPGEPQYDQLVDDPQHRDQLFRSWLTVNYDPGRGLKYLGSLLIVAGIAIMFYMRAYFFRRPTPTQNANTANTT